MLRKSGCQSSTCLFSTIFLPLASLGQKQIRSQHPCLQNGCFKSCWSYNSYNCLQIFLSPRNKTCSQGCHHVLSALSCVFDKAGFQMFRLMESYNSCQCDTRLSAVVCCPWPRHWHQIVSSINMVIIFLKQNLCLGTVNVFDIIFRDRSVICKIYSG